MNSSPKRTKGALSIWQFSLLITVAYIIGMLISHHTTVFEKIYWSGYDLQVMTESGEWTKSNRFNIGNSDGTQKIRFTINIDESEKWQRPIGLMAGGPFSAKIFWDGEEIGNKGLVGNEFNEEKPGPIDSMSFVPTHLLSPGEHQITLHISTQHLLTEDKSVFHYIWLAPYRENGRRDLRYYTAPLIILSVLIVLSLQSLRIGHNAGNPMHTGLGLFGLSITILLLSEVSRALVNYPYHYHELRGAIAWLSNVGAGLALVYTCFRTTEGRWRKNLLVAGIFIVLASYFIPLNSGDRRLALDFILLAAGPALVYLIQFLKHQISYLTTLLLFVISCVVSNSISTGLFLDSFQFIASLILIGGAWVWVNVEINNETAEQPQHNDSDRFIVGGSEDERVILTDDCYVLKGEGNYTTLMLTNGTSVLHQDGLGAVMETHPLGFVRVHKSYAVNIHAITKLRSATGSKYWVELYNGESIPISRYRVVELRGLLSDQKINKK